jgi:hypothetical protein
MQRVTFLVSTIFLVSLSLLFGCAAADSSVEEPQPEKQETLSYEEAAKTTIDFFENLTEKMCACESAECVRARNEELQGEPFKVSRKVARRLQNDPELQARLNEFSERLLACAKEHEGEKTAANP